MFWLGIRSTSKSPSYGTVCHCIDPGIVAANWHANSLNGLRRVHECNRQTDKPPYGEMCRNRRSRISLCTCAYGVCA